MQGFYLMRHYRGVGLSWTQSITTVLIPDRSGYLYLTDLSQSVVSPATQCCNNCPPKYWPCPNLLNVSVLMLTFSIQHHVPLTQISAKHHNEISFSLNSSSLKQNNFKSREHVLSTNKQLDSENYLRFCKTFYVSL